jgi:hypothetical protein
MWSPVPRLVLLWARLQAAPAVQSSVRRVKVPQQAQ